ncbi:MAG: penicillin-binding protein 2 [Stanieria sp.]
MAKSKPRNIPQRPKRISQPSSAKSTKKFQPIRLLLVWLVLVGAAVGLTGRLFYLQILNPTIVYEQAPKGKTLKQIANDQQHTLLRFYNPRRQIVDRQQNVLATDRITYDLYAHPSLFTVYSKDISPEQVAQELAPILPNYTTEKLVQIFDQRKTGIKLASDLPESVKEKISKLKIDGLDLQKRYSRFYPYEEMVAEVVGYMNRDRLPLPQAGVEYTQQQLLQRPEITKSVKRSFIGDRSIFHLGDLNPQEELLQFDDLRLQLTLDLKIQQAARNALKQQMLKYKAKRGTVIVMDVRDGAIASLVSEPTYNPNLYYKYNVELFKNWAITDLYEPGSTFKPINVAIALDAGVITPNDTFKDTGKIKVDGWEIRNHDYEDDGARGILTIPQILQHSSNVGMIQMMNRLNREDYYHHLLALGIEDKLALDIPGYTPGHLKNEIEFKVKAIEAATTSFGQGFSLTPLKLIQLHCAIANGGNLVTPHFVRGLSDVQGYLHWQPTYPSKQVFKPETTKAVLAMMESVVREKEGSGYVAHIPGYRIAGKTGTAQKAVSEGGYDKKAKITSFVAMFPVEAPRYAILAVVDEPKGADTFGSTVAAPIVKSVMEAIIAIEGIPPAQ